MVNNFGSDLEEENKTFDLTVLLIVIFNLRKFL